MAKLNFSTSTNEPFWQTHLVCFLPLLGYGIFLCEAVTAFPNLLWASFLLFWSLGATLFAIRISKKDTQQLWDTIDRYANHLVIGLIITASVVFILINVFQTYYFTPGRDAEDTAYYGQLLWNTVHGEFLSGNLQQERIYDPPVSTDLALHVSPILLVLAPIYGIFSDPLALLVIRDITLIGAAWPLFLLAREQMGRVAGVAAAILYVINPTIIAQGFDAFYLLQLAPLPFFYALRAFVRADLGWFLCWMGAALSLREDVAIAFAGFGVWAIVRRRRFSWILVGLAIPVLWWGVATQVIQPAFGRQGNGALDIALAGEQNSFGAYQILLGHPAWFIEGLSNGGLEYLYRIFRSVAFLSLLGLEGFLVVPSVIANLFLGRVFDSGLYVTSRFSVLPACALIGATVLVVTRLSRNSFWDRQAFAIILLLLFPSVSLLDGVKDAVQERLAASVVHNDAAALREGITYIPDTASVAAPKYALPALANRQRLYFLQNFSEYPQGTLVDYYLIDRNLEGFDRNLERRTYYVALMEKLSSSPDYKLLWQKGEYALYQRHLPTEGRKSDDH